MRIALAQLQSQNKWKINLKRIRLLVRHASNLGAKAVLFPENCLFMGDPKRLATIAEEIHPSVLSTLQEDAKKHRVAIFIGSYPERKKGSKKVYNTAVWIAETGKILARYRKIHLFDATLPGGKKFRESQDVDPGKQTIVFKWKGVSIGLSICFDLRFPEQFREMAKKGAEWLLVPSAFTRETGKAHWQTLLQARAIENFATVIAPAQTGTHPKGRQTFGHSLVVDPWGETILDAGTAPGIEFVDLDTIRSKKLRKVFPTTLSR